MGRTYTIHFVDQDVRSRAEVAREALALGHHAEVYAELEELAKHPPREGIVIAREDAAPGGVSDILAKLYAMAIALPLVIASENATVGKVVEAVRAGALDYLQLPVEQDQLAALIERASSRATAETSASRRVIEARQRLASLSDREREVLELLVDGGSNKRIARELSISPRTVEIHRANMMQKLDAKHVADAVRLHWEARL
ncbi:MAG: helix-turn-helix transcriptional regulator [Novosphingobium sp.]|nr:helix-turn-helix transcriptional regulator [Novosphingobium sp.]MBO9601440.1 helix-turn-helix transcriptional regulator [Novosphingobium sp.]